MLRNLDLKYNIVIISLKFSSRNDRTSMTAAELEQLDWQLPAGGGEQQPRVSAAVTAGDSSCGARVSDAETSGPVQQQPGAVVTSHTTLQSSDISESGRVSSLPSLASHDK